MPCQSIDSVTNTVTWNFSLTNYQNNEVPPGTYTFTFEVDSDGVKETFSIDLVLQDPCDPPTSMTPSTPFVNQVYTLTETGQSYTHPDFVVDPSYCPEPSYTYAHTNFVDSNSNSASSITENGKISEFFWDADKSPLTQTQTITVTATSTSIYGAQNPSNANASFDLSFADPCIDTNFVTISQTA